MPVPAQCKSIETHCIWPVGPFASPLRKFANWGKFCNVALCRTTPRRVLPCEVWKAEVVLLHWRYVRALCLYLIEGGSSFRLRQENGGKVISTRNRMGLLGFLTVLAGMAVLFGAEEGLVEEKAWSNEMAAIENATQQLQRDARKFRFALMDDMTWSLANDACTAISKEYDLCTVSQLCSQTEDGLKAHTLCQPASQCDGLEAVGGFKGRWAPVQKLSGVSDGEWVNVEEKCKVIQLPERGSFIPPAPAQSLRSCVPRSETSHRKQQLRVSWLVVTTEWCAPPHS